MFVEYAFRFGSRAGNLITMRGMDLQFSAKVVASISSFSAVRARRLGRLTAAKKMIVSMPNTTAFTNAQDLITAVLRISKPEIRTGQDQITRLRKRASPIRSNQFCKESRLRVRAVCAARFRY